MVNPVRSDGSTSGVNCTLRFCSPIALEKAIANKEIGILLLTEKFGREFPAIIDTFRLERKMPLLVEIPDRHGTGRKKDFITSYITEAIGLKL